ncbi:MAG: ABC transporter ATP-binding protein [archaeon]
MRIELKGIGVAYKDWKLENFSSVFKSGSFVSVLGPSGSGKTTLLRLLCGLEKPSSGKILFGEKDVTKTAPEERNLGVVFQGNSLFSHLDVFGNVAFGLKMKKEKDLEKKVSEALRLVHFEGFGRRNVNFLSGGEQKRVAIARAIAFNPSALLLDEPFNGLDARLKESLKVLLKELRAKTGLTVILVTHDLDEAFFLSDRLIVMNNGSKEQEGTPFEVLLKPANSFVKDFFSDYFVVEAKQQKSRKGNVIIGNFSVPAQSGSGKPVIIFKKTNYRFIDGKT